MSRIRSVKQMKRVLPGGVTWDTMNMLLSV